MVMEIQDNTSFIQNVWKQLLLISYSNNSNSKQQCVRYIFTCKTRNSLNISQPRPEEDLINTCHTFFVERGRWSNPKVEYIDRLCSLCDQRDIEDEYHILLDMSTLFRSKSEIHQETVLCSTKHA